mgnify:CR=1 FL=1
MEPGNGVIDRIVANVEKVIVGKRDVVELAVVALLCQGHLLIEDVPGVGKTTLAKSIAKSVGCSFRRLQFTPDLLPSDVTGVSIFNQRTMDFEFRQGPIFAQIVLVDEVNRATPKTQSALLEAMEERQVTVDGNLHPLPSPFLVMATQNPIEYEGTFPLPEAQLDRFLMRLHLGYPAKLEDEVEILDKQQTAHPIETLDQVGYAYELIRMQAQVKAIYVDPLVKQYIVSIAAGTREHEDVYLGASPRGSLGLMRTSQALALLRGQDFVMPDFVKELAQPTLAHRVIVNPAARVKDITAETVVADVVNRVPVPGARASRWIVS